MSIASRATAALDRRASAMAEALVTGDMAIEFASPVGEAAIVTPSSVSWQVFRNPISLLIGGIAAVLLELGEPRVRSGVWSHSSFRTDPVRRLRRTGLAAMVTVYGARSRFEALAAKVGTMHGRVAGVTPAGQAYRADDPDLLRWVHATAAFAFVEAYRAYVRPVALVDRDRYYAEGAAGAALYGATGTPLSEAAMAALLAAMRPSLEASPVIDELIAILRAAPILPPLLRPVQHMVIRAAVDLLPAAERDRLGLARHGGLRFGEAAVLRTLARTVDRLALPSSPSAQACVRMGLPHDWLVRRPLPG